MSISIFKIDTTTSLPLPYADGGIKAGFPSPAQDYLDQSIDLNKELIKNPATTFVGRVDGDSMINAGLFDGDLFLIDKSLDPRDHNGAIAVCFIDGEFTVKHIKVEKKTKVVWLIPANDKYSHIKVTPDNEFIIWGIAIFSINNLLKRKLPECLL